MPSLKSGVTLTMQSGDCFVCENPKNHCCGFCKSSNSQKYGGSSLNISFTLPSAISLMLSSRHILRVNSGSSAFSSAANGAYGDRYSSLSNPSGRVMTNVCPAAVYLCDVSIYLSKIRFF